MTAFLDAHPWLVFAAGLAFYVGLWFLLVASPVRRETSRRRDSLAQAPGRVEGAPPRAAGAGSPASASADGMVRWDAEAQDGREWWPR